MLKKYVLGMIAGLSLCANVVMADKIHPISREMGSGTRGAFTEIFHIQKEIQGKKVDGTTDKAEVTNSTGVMITTVSNDKDAIGYISLGSLKDNVKAVSIDGVAPSVANVNNKTYKVSRPFNVVVKEENALIKDFLDYAVNAKDVIEKAGYIPNKPEKYASKKPSGKLRVVGSSSVTPLMQKLAESYKSVNPNATIEISQSDSTTGVNSIVEGIADIGMVSRDLKLAELEKGIKNRVLAIDGLAVIVNKSNPVKNISKEQVQKIFKGEITDWKEVK
ncbi:substrate-binding domain-containing protein [Helicobacter saguini]|uniref:substrate-binding domain-containing protein n=1 Tax=Helicobacter saguini TaxID=1548018 RepID=UPI001F39C5E0|nr:substrate-binding domain-containing protein [Helicobacter saguini]